MRSGDIEIRLPGVNLQGSLTLVQKPKGIVVFSHGSGSSRHSPRNRFVAHELQSRGFSTLLFDLLTQEEDEVYENRFNITLLAQRLSEVCSFIASQPDLSDLPIGIFGASTGTASALITASVMPDKIRAVVSRGGRPDMASGYLDKVQAPVLLIVGSLDEEVIEMNRAAAQEMNCLHRITIVEGATHLFEEEGKLAVVAELASAWFSHHLASVRKPES